MFSFSPVCTLWRIASLCLPSLQGDKPICVQGILRTIPNITKMPQKEKHRPNYQPNNDALLSEINFPEIKKVNSINDSQANNQNKFRYVKHNYASSFKSNESNLSSSSIPNINSPSQRSAVSED